MHKLRYDVLLFALNPLQINLAYSPTRVHRKTVPLSYDLPLPLFSTSVSSHPSSASHRYRHHHLFLFILFAIHLYKFSSFSFFPLSSLSPRTSIHYLPPWFSPSPPLPLLLAIFITTIKPSPPSLSPPSSPSFSLSFMLPIKEEC